MPRRETNGLLLLSYLAFPFDLEEQHVFTPGCWFLPQVLSYKEASGCPGQRLLWSTYLWLTETAKQSGCPGGQAQPTPTSTQLSRWAVGRKWPG